LHFCNGWFILIENKGVLPFMARKGAFSAFADGHASQTVVFQGEEGIIYE